MNKQVCYRIYTENRSLDGIYNAVKFYFSGATVYTGKRFYNNCSLCSPEPCDDIIAHTPFLTVIEENSVIIEIVNGSDPNFHNRIVRFAEAIKKSNEQTSVLITRSEIEAEYV